MKWLNNIATKLSPETLYRACLGTALFLCAFASIFWSWHWPLVGDASLMHYVVFLMHRGFAPYKEIVDVNLPGSYLAETTAMRIFGWGARGWRIYDLCLMLALVASALQISRRKDLFAGFLAGTLFLLIHVQDGIAQLGQRDLLIAVLLVCSYAILYHAQQHPGNGLPTLMYGLVIGATATIKPLFLPLGALLLVISSKRARERGLASGIHIGFGAFGLLLPSLLLAIWLWSRGALPQFLHAFRELIPFHASLGHKSAAYLLAHSTAPLMPLFILWVLVWALQRRPLDLERVELLIGAGMALLAYFLQGKGYPYHRYPLLALLLLLMGMDFSAGLRQKRWIRGLSAVALALACFFIAPRAAWLVRTFQPATPFEDALAHELQNQKVALSGNVQCLDTFGGCINTLYNLRVVQSTGFLYDCYLFEPGHHVPADEYRAAFWRAYQQSHPEIVVLTSQYCFGADNFQKIDLWPQLRDDLSDSYNLVAEWHATQPQHWWARREMPAQYRIYVRKRGQ